MTIPPDEIAEFASRLVSDDFDGVTISPPTDEPTMDPAVRDRELQLRTLGPRRTTPLPGD